MSTQSLQVRLNLLLESLKQTNQLITRLSKLSASPGAGPSRPDEGDARVELSTEIHQSLKEQEEDFELLRQEAEDHLNRSGQSNIARRKNSGKDRGTADIATQIDRLGEDLQIARVQFRKAQLTAKRSAEVAKRKERELLFAGIQEGTEPSTLGYGRRKGQEKLSQEELLLNASSDVTAALRRTHNLMSSELERSQFARETLENSTKDLNTLSESYTNLDTLLSSSRSLVSTLIHSQKSDTWYLESAFLILIITIGWLLFRRILYGPGWWLVYFPLRLIWTSSLLALQSLASVISTAAGAVGAKGSSRALEQVSGKIGASLSYTPTAKGKAGIPTFADHMPAPSRKVGAGGQGAKADDVQAGDKPLSAQIGKMAETAEKATREGKEDAGQENQGTVLRDRKEDEKPNPKKRMWEEPVGEVSSSSLPRDEL